MIAESQTRLSTGIAGLDDILRGGLAKGFLYLIEGNPGAGKTTLALQFLIEGARRGEKGLYISLAESEPELRHVAESHGMTLENVEICKISPLRLPAKRDSNIRYSSRPRLNWPTSSKQFSPKSATLRPPASLLTPCRSYACWRAILCATGDKC